MSSTAVSVLRGRSHPFRRNGWTCTVRAIAVRFRRARVSPSSRSSFPSLAARTLTSRCSGCGTKHDAHAPSRRRTRSARRSRRFPRRFFSRSFAGASAPFPLASFVLRAPRAPRLRPLSCRTIATRVLRIGSKARWDRSQVHFDVNGDENKQGGSDGEEGKASMKGRDEDRDPMEISMKGGRDRDPEEMSMEIAMGGREVSMGEVGWRGVGSRPISRGSGRVNHLPGSENRSS